MRAMLAGFAAAIVIAVIAGAVLTGMNVETGQRFAAPDSVRID